MGRASYQYVDNLRIGSHPCGRIGAIEASLRPLLRDAIKAQPLARLIGAAYPECRKVIELLPIEGRRCFHYRDAEGNLRFGELK